MVIILSVTDALQTAIVPSTWHPIRYDLSLHAASTYFITNIQWFIPGPSSLSLYHLVHFQHVTWLVSVHSQITRYFSYHSKKSKHQASFSPLAKYSVSSNSQNLKTPGYVELSSRLMNRNS